MPYYRLFYHLVWATKHRHPLLTSEIEPIIHGYLRAKAIKLETIVFALNGTADHVHLVVSVPSKLALARFIGQVKGVASTIYNKTYPHKPSFFWQAEYGAFTFDAKRLPNYISYVERQKIHHAEGTTIPILERTTDSPHQAVHEWPATYALDDAGWRRELEFLS